MAQAKPLFTKVEQISMVVRDARESARFLCDTYGIGPWICVQFGDAGDGNDNWIPIEDVVLDGKYVGTYSIDCCVCDLPSGIQLEIISPKAGDSVFSRFLAEKGPGIQHISINNGDYEETLDRMAQAGYRPGQTATVDKVETCTFVDHKDVIGCYLEIHRRPENFTLPQVRPEFIPGPGPEDRPAVTPLFDDFDQIGIVVPDVERAVRVLNDEYGISPWILLDFGDCGRGEFVTTENVVLDGKEVGSFATRAAICDALNIQLEIMEPVSKKGVHYECLKKYGPMTQHLSMKQSLPYEEIKRRMDEAGFTGGQVATVDTTETCLYADHMDLLGMYLEVHKRPEVFVPPQVKFETYPPNLDIKL